jgi:hypothetical protein
MIRDPLTSPANFPGVLAVRTHAGNSQQFTQIVFELLPVIDQILFKIRQVSHNANLLTERILLLFTHERFRI